jgi:hypothetical protein
VTVLLSAVLLYVDQPLRTDAAPQGIVSFELAGDEATARRIIESWDTRARLYGAFSLGIDYLYLVAYSTTIALACLWAAGVLGGALRSAGEPLAWGQWVAAFFDASENVGLTVLLLGGVSSPWPAVARWCALPKFVLLTAGILYALAGGLARLSGRRAA